MNIQNLRDPRMNVKISFSYKVIKFFSKVLLLEGSFWPLAIGQILSGNEFFDNIL
jgi:hypothetical protein